MFIESDKSLEGPNHPVVKFGAGSKHFCRRQRPSLGYELGAHTKEGNRGRLTPERVPPLLLTEYKMHQIMCASRLELPRRHTHKDLANKLVVVLLQEIRSRDVSRPGWSNAMPLACSLGLKCVPYSWSFSAVPFLLRLFPGLPCFMGPGSLARSPLSAALGGVGASAVAFASGRRRRFLFPGWADEASCSTSEASLLVSVRDLFADFVVAPPASAALGALLFPRSTSFRDCAMP